MRKHFAKLLMGFWVIVFLTSCKANGSINRELSQAEENSIYPLAGVMADVSLIEDNKKDLASMTAYSLSELEAFFGNANRQLRIVNEDPCDELIKEQVEESFPGGISRSPNYVVYRVAEGGYYFVFYMPAYAGSEKPEGSLTLIYPLEEAAEVVRSSYYLPALPSFEEFSALEVGHSTAQDVIALSSATDFSFFLSSGIYSYSLLRDGCVAKICYDNAGADRISMNNLIVSGISLCPREDAPSCFATVWSEDIEAISDLDQ